MKLIALASKSNTGKTSTLKIVYEFLEKESNLIRNESKWVVERKGIFKYNRKIICITTRRDNEKCLKEDWKWFKRNAKKVDVVICPCHTKGNTMRFIKNKAKNKCEDAYIFQKSYLANYQKETDEYDKHKEVCDKLNKQQADHIIELIKML